mgnify:CR=1 FL=1
MQFESILLPGIEPTRPLVIAGPCSAESEEQILTTGHALAKKGIKIFRAGIWKPRTKPGLFEGVGVIGLPWLQRLKQETGMYTTVEVANKAHVDAALAFGIDMLWIGARTTANPFAMQEIADALKGHEDVPILIKNPVNPDIELWIGGIERIYRAGLHRIAVIHRGFSSDEKKIYRNLPQWHIPIELRRRYPNLPIICDPSHIAGRRDLIQPLSQQAMDLGFDGLIVESHYNPDIAWSDAKQQLDPDVLAEILKTLVIRDKITHNEDLAELRSSIDEIDVKILDILAKRMHISEEIALYKRENDVQVLQAGRYDEILKTRKQQGAEMGMSEEFVQEIFEAIHAESVRKQLLIMNQ